ncbi:MAG: PDZ domain-containing protein [Bacillota bacterium]
MVKTIPLVMVYPATAGMFWIIVALVAMQYRRAASLEERIWGVSFGNILELALSSVVLGLLGGALASLVITLVGISLSESGIEYLLPLALLLYVVNPRLMCFSYAGGIISLAHLVTGYPEVSVPEIMALVAVLHVTESLLIRISGHGCASPIYTRHSSGRVVGGFSLQRFWPVPLVALFMLSVADPSKLPGLIQMPDWWPLVRAPIAEPDKVVFALVPVTAALGYSDVAVSTLPQQKTRRTALALAAYSVLLLIASLLAVRYWVLQWVAALLGPLGHEVVASLGGKKELASSPMFVPPERGVMVLSPLPGSEAQAAGIEPGDIILEANGVPVNCRDELVTAVAASGWYLELEVRSWRGHPKRIEFRRPVTDLGVITVPEAGDSSLVEFGQRKNLGWFKSLIRGIGGWFRRAFVRR